MFRPESAGDTFHRAGTAQRTLTRAPGVPSQDVTRYPAKDMPPPKYDLAQKDDDFIHALLVPVAAVLTGAVVALIQRLSAWLGR